MEGHLVFLSYLTLRFGDICWGLVCMLRWFLVFHTQKTNVVVVHKCFQQNSLQQRAKPLLAFFQSFYSPLLFWIERPRIGKLSRHLRFSALNYSGARGKVRQAHASFPFSARAPTITPEKLPVTEGLFMLMPRRKARGNHGTGCFIFTRSASRGRVHVVF